MIDEILKEKIKEAMEELKEAADRLLRLID
jgi:hypothetical protein